jgi:hypothetical protein
MDDYRAAQLALGEAAAESDDDDDDEDDDDDDEFGSDNLHAGDLDGVDIDEALEALDLQVDEPDEAEAESDSRSEDPPRVTGRRKRASKEQQNNQGD